MNVIENKDKISSHLFEYRSVERKKLIISLIITLTVMFLEIIGGLITFSIALISDAGHMFTHAFAIGISLLAIIIARKPPCHHKTFGLYRAEVLAAFINGIFLLVVVGIILFEAVDRFLNPHEIVGFYMFLIALIGLATNITSILILKGTSNKSLNVRSVFYHMIADAASSIAIVVVSIIIFYTQLTFLDPLVSIIISLFILYWAWGILRESVRILLEMSPKGLNIDIIEQDLKINFKEVLEVYHSHLWTITPDMLVFSAHIVLNDDIKDNTKESIILKLNEYLSKKFNIAESTLQVDLYGEAQACYFS
ncbi:MAG: cation diffusion facilitator family transporter [Candidatus Thorarchaeota archaeon]